MTERLRSWLARALVAALWFVAPQALAQTGGYQGGLVRLVVTNAPGTAPDVIGRTLAQRLHELRNLPVIVETRVGVQGMVGGEVVVRSPPDGSMLLLASDTVTTVLPHLPEKMSFDPLKDLRPIALVADAGYVLVVHPTLKVKSLADFVALAKSRPGAIDYASTGVNSAHNRTMLQFMSMAGITMNHVPYGSTGPLLDVVAGTVPVMWSGLPGALPQIQAGKLIALAQSSPRRHPSLGAVATADELGYPGFDEVNWFGIMGPAGMPEALVRAIQADVLRIVETTAFRDRMIAQGMAARPGTSEAFVQLIQRDFARNRGRIKIEPLRAQ